VALISADLFAALLGQRDIEHQDEHPDSLSIFPDGPRIAGLDRRAAA
jgi:hypothetical protein